MTDGNNVALGFDNIDPQAMMQVDFFKDIPLEREGIAFVYTPEGRPKGEAYVEFPTEETQKEALKRHKNAINDRYIELFISSKANMLQANQGNLLA